LPCGLRLSSNVRLTYHSDNIQNQKHAVKQHGECHYGWNGGGRRVKDRDGASCGSRETVTNEKMTIRAQVLAITGA